MDDVFVVWFRDYGDREPNKWEAYCTVEEAIVGAHDCVVDRADGADVWVKGYPSGATMKAGELFDATKAAWMSAQERHRQAEAYYEALARGEVISARPIDKAFDDAPPPGPGRLCPCCGERKAVDDDLAELAGGGHVCPTTTMSNVGDQWFRPVGDRWPFDVPRGRVVRVVVRKDWKNGSTRLELRDAWGHTTRTRVRMAQASAILVRPSKAVRTSDNPPSVK